MIDNDFKRKEQLNAVSVPLPTALQELDEVIQKLVSHISDFTKNKSDFTRNRKLNAFNTIKTLLNMAGQSLNKEIFDAFPEVSERMTASAFEQQKAKLSPKVLLKIFHDYSRVHHDQNLYEGKYELYAIDGTDFNLPYQSKSKYAMKPSSERTRKDGEPAKHCSILHANMLSSLTDKEYRDFVLQPKSQTEERAAAIEMLERLNPSNPYIVLMDRGYDGFNMIEHGNRLNGEGYYVIRLRTGESAITEVKELPDCECDEDVVFKVTTSKYYYAKNKDKERIHLINCPQNHFIDSYSPNTKYHRWDFGKFEDVKTRLVKFLINDPDTGKQTWEVLATNLDRNEFPVWKMKELYFKRWGIETSFRDLKYSLGAVQFHSRKDDFIEMDLISHLIMFNAISRTIRKTEVPPSDKRKYEYAISFKEAVTIVRKYFRIKCKDDPLGIYAELQRYIVPIMPGRTFRRRMRPKSAVSFMYRVA
ncbi:MAG: IS4 family transposase [bacterium]|nr:IS4 family transposase [bacterium]